MRFLDPTQTRAFNQFVFNNIREFLPIFCQPANLARELQTSSRDGELIPDLDSLETIMQRRISTLWMAAMWAAVTATAATTIPLDMSSGRPVVEIVVNGGNSLTMVLDTGASGSVINAETARELGLEVVGEEMVGDPSGKNQHATQVVALPDVTIGATSLGEIRASALDLPKAIGHARHGIDGVLSVRDLERYLVTLDLAAGELRLSSGQLNPDATDVVPFYTDDMAIPWIHALVGPLTVHAFLDTGNPGLLSLSKATAKHLELDGPLEVIGEGRTVSSTFEISAAPLAGEVTFAGQSIKNPTLLFDELHRGTQANIGSGLLSQFVVTLDQSNKLVRFATGRGAQSHQQAVVMGTHSHPRPKSGH